MNETALERWNTGFSTVTEEFLKSKIANSLLFAGVILLLLYVTAR